MDHPVTTSIPHRAETLKVLGLMGDYAPILMLCGDDNDGYGTRWTIDGHPIEPAIAVFLMRSNYLADIGRTEQGARMLALTEAGIEFRRAGQHWWNGLGSWQRLKVRLFG